MAKVDNVSTKEQTDNIPKKHHFFRTFFAVIFGFISLNLIIISILVIWLSATVTNTKIYVQTVSSVAENRSVQEFVSAKGAEVLTENPEIPIRDLAGQLLSSSEVENRTDDELRESVKSVVKEELSKILSSEEFAQLWRDTHQDLHKKLIAQIEGKGSDLTLDLVPIIEGSINLLDDQKFGFIKEKIEVPEDMGKITLESTRFENAREVYSYFKLARLALIGCSVLSGLLSVLISVHHLKTLRRILLLTGIFTGLLAVLLSATSLLNSINAKAEDKALAIALVNTVLKDLRLALVVISLLCLGISIGSKVIGLIVAKTKKSS